MRVLVTGATGFIGRHMCPALLAAGHDVSVAVRRKDFPDMPEAAAFHVVPDIGPKTDWTEALAGAEAVVHLAARAHVTEEPAADSAAEFHRVNAEGTASLAAAAAAAGVRRFLYLSSSRAAGERTGDRPFSESDPPKPKDAYGTSKWDGEKALLDIASQSGLEAVILRPPLVYGPGVKGNFLRLLKLCRLGPPLPFAAVNNRRSFIYVGNLADAAVHCLGAEEAAGETYFVRDGEDMSTPDLIRRLALAANSFWYPQKYLKTAQYFSTIENRPWADVDPAEVLGARYSSLSGWNRNVNAPLMLTNFISRSRPRQRSQVSCGL